MAIYELYKEERYVLNGEMREVSKVGMISFGTLDSVKTIAIPGDRCWPQTVKQEGDKVCRRFVFV